jgi:hypothetical protein
VGAALRAFATLRLLIFRAVGWVERQRNPSTNHEGCMMGFVSLDPSYNSRRLRHVMQHQKFGVGARRDCIGAALIIGKLDERRTIAELFDDRADLPARQFLGWKIGEQGHHVEQRGLSVVSGFVPHHITQHVTNRGASLPPRTIRTVLTITCLLSL